MQYPAYYKNHDSSAFVCLIALDKYMEVRRLANSVQVSFGRNSAIREMCKDLYLTSTEDDFKKTFAAGASKMAEMFDAINH